MDPHRARELVRRWLLTTGCFALLLFFFSPNWAAFRAWYRVPELQGMIEVRRGANVLIQMANPGVSIPDKLHAAIQWRLFFPWIGHLLHLSPGYLFALAHVGCVLVLGFVLSLLRKQGWDWMRAAQATLIVGASAWFFASTGWLGYFDSWIVLALLIVAFTDQSWLRWLACACAPWIDERFVLGVPLAIGCRAVYLSQSGSSLAEVWRTHRREMSAAVGIIAVFVVIRLAVLPSRSATGATITGYLLHHDSLRAPVFNIALGIAEGLRVGWIFVLAALALAWRRERTAAVGLAVAVVVLIAIGVATAQDFDRAMMLIVPVSVVGLLAARTAGKTWLPRALQVGSMATLLLPAHHVMSDRITPIYYLYDALAAFESPPPAVMPELHELRGIRAMERGEFIEAAEALSLAIRLSSNPAAPAKTRGVLFATHQQWKEAAQDFTTVVEHEPSNPEGWFLRAQARLATGDIAGAQSDMKAATACAPARWLERADVVRFMTRLKERG